VTLTSSRWKRGVLDGTTGVWSGLGFLAGRAGRWKPAAWSSPGGQRVLVIAPHPDDELGCGGALLLHERAGDEVHVVYVTDGRGSGSHGLGPDEMARRRREEAVAVTPVLRLPGMQWLGLREYDWEESLLVPLLQDVLRRMMPQVVYAPSLIDFHPEHVRVGQCLARAVADPGLHDMTVRVYQIQVPLTPVLANLVAPMQAVVPELIKAMECYRTQLGSIKRFLRMKRYGASFYGLTGFAEEFWQIDRHASVRLHAAGAGERMDDAFRGVRYLPFTDPLAYLRGLGARRRLRELATSP
jgi:LmbE family N-acetylglucosaminyl deacetylase